ncbi:MAG TPA: hypothetical protein PK323_05160 [Bacteroidia bacterium]|nr:hypothetical protein [Bacteroidia bacterium]
MQKFKLLIKLINFEELSFTTQVKRLALAGVLKHKLRRMQQQMKKIEELTIHLVEMQKEIERLKSASK